MTLDEMEAKRHSQLDKPTNVATTKDNLLRDHKKADVSMNRLKGKRVGNIQYLVTLKYVSTVKCVRKESVKVWMGKPKGILQVLWEHIFMETSTDVCTYYTKLGQENNYVNTIIETCFRELM